MATSVLDSLLVELGFVYDPKDLKGFKEDLDNVKNAIDKVAKVAIGAAVALTGLVFATSEAVDTQGKLASKIGVSVETLSALEFAAQIAGDSSDSLRSSLLGLSKTAGEAARGVGGGIEAFGILGVEVLDVNGNLKDTDQLLLEVSDRLQGLSKQQQLDLAGKLGLSDTLLLLQQGPERIQELVREAKLLGVTTGEDAAIASEFQDSLVRLWAIIKNISRTITTALSPAIKENIEVFTNWWKSNKNIIESKLPEWIRITAIAARFLSVALVGLISVKVILLIIDFIKLIKSATVAMIAFGSSSLFVPVVIVAGLTALLLILEDVNGFFKGQDSIIGDLIKKYPEWAKEIIAVAEALKLVLDVGSKIKGFVGKAEGIVSFENLTKLVKSLPPNLSTPSPDIPASVIGPANNRPMTFIDTINIDIQGGSDAADVLANRVFREFEQASTDLQKGVDQ